MGMFEIPLFAILAISCRIRESSLIWCHHCTQFWVQSISVRRYAELRCRVLTSIQSIDLYFSWYFTVYDHEAKKVLANKFETILPSCIKQIFPRKKKIIKNFPSMIENFRSESVNEMMKLRKLIDDNASSQTSQKVKGRVELFY